MLAYPQNIFSAAAAAVQNHTEKSKEQTAGTDSSDAIFVSIDECIVHQYIDNWSLQTLTLMKNN